MQPRVRIVTNTRDHGLVRGEIGMRGMTAVLNGNQVGPVRAAPEQLNALVHAPEIRQRVCDQRILHRAADLVFLTEWHIEPTDADRAEPVAEPACANVLQLQVSLTETELLVPLAQRDVNFDERVEPAADFRVEVELGVVQRELPCGVLALASAIEVGHREIPREHDALSERTRGRFDARGYRGGFLHASDFRNFDRVRLLLAAPRSDLPAQFVELTFERLHALSKFAVLRREFGDFRRRLALRPAAQGEA